MAMQKDTDNKSPDLSQTADTGQNVDSNSLLPDQAFVDNEEAQELADKDNTDVDPLAAVTEERDKLKDQLLRALADTENMRRRSEREAETARKYGHTQFAREIIGAIDNLERALESAPEEKTELDESVQSLLTGIDLSWREIQTAIEKHGVRRIHPLGEKFDYNFHQAMFEVPTNEHPPGMVLEVVQHGYALHERLLRPAMVGVSKPFETVDTGAKET